MKKVLSLVLALVMVLGSFSFVSAAPMSDIAGTANEDAIVRLESLALLTGYPDGTFKPAAQITRAEFAAVMVRAKGLEAVAATAKGLPTGFADVPANHWAAGYVGTASKLGIILGDGKGNFAPEAPVKYEDAITMVVRALGYEASAATKGGYPYGYLIVAKEIDLLDDAKGTQGLPATRAFVAQITDNALEIPMMVQVGFGTETKWVVSGSEEHGDNAEEKFLLDEMGFEPKEGVATFTDKNKDDLKVKIDGITYKVNEGFDYFEVEGVTIKAYVDSKDKVIVYTLKDEVKFDAVDVTGSEIKLIGEDETYDLDLLTGNNASDADYAKVVFNKDGEVVNVLEYNFTGVLVVEKIDDEIVYGFNDEELDLEDYVLVEDGKTVTEVEEGDVVFFNNDIAVIYNKSEVGEITRIYSNSLKLDSKTYELSDLKYYLDGDEMKALTAENQEDTLQTMMDEESEVEIFLDFAGKVAVVAGERGVAATSDFYGYVTADADDFEVRNKNYFNLDLLNKDAEEVKFDVKLPTTGLPTINAGEVVKVTVDEDGDYDSYAAITKTFVFGDDEAEEVFKVTNNYAGIYRLQDSAVVFLTEPALDAEGNVDDIDDIKVMTWADVEDEFTEITDATFYANSSNKVIAVVVRASDAEDAETTDYYGLVTKVRELPASGRKEITIEVDGQEYEFLTDKDEDSVVNGVYENEFAKLEIGDTSDLIIRTLEFGLVEDVNVDLDGISTSDKTIKAGNETYRLVDGYVIYDADGDVITLRDLKDTDTLTFALDEIGTTFVKYVKVQPAE